MKIFLISNTLFGYKNMTKYQISYFYDILIPFLKQKSKKGDIFVHGGNLFYNKIHADFNLINNVLDIFDKISKILPIYVINSLNDKYSTTILNRLKNIFIIDNSKIINNNVILISNKLNLLDIKNIKPIIIFNSNFLINESYKLFLKNFDISICTYFNNNDIIDNIINIGSPYQLNNNYINVNDFKNKNGLLIIDTIKKKFKLVKNKYSPNFISYDIFDISDLNKININKKDKIEIIIKENILNNKENINKFNLFINNNNIKVKYLIKKNSNNSNDNNKIKNITYDFNIRNIIKNTINDTLLNELNTIYKIYDST